MPPYPLCKILLAPTPRKKIKLKVEHLYLLWSKLMIHKSIDGLNSFFVGFGRLVVPILFVSNLGAPVFELFQKVNRDQPSRARTSAMLKSKIWKPTSWLRL